jgi:hypothetical protein
MFIAHEKRIIGAAVLLFLAGGSFLFSLSSLSSQDQMAQQNDRLTLKIAVMGPGDELYFWWGHIALIIEDNAAGKSSFYDWGVFSFDSDHFFTNFAFGRLTYMCAVSPSERNIRNYIASNRDITLYTLDLSPERKDLIKALAEENVRPENRDYEYHHFYQNCATIIRDIISGATDGQFEARFGEAPGRYTLRQHVRRHTWFSPFYDWLLNFLMGQDIDVPLTIWQEMFLPAEIGNRIADFTYIDESATTRKLVSSIEIRNKAVNRPAILDVPRTQWPRELLVGILIAVLLSLFGILRNRHQAGRYLWGLSQSALGAFFGIVGLVLFFMTFFTNHDYTYHNANIMYLNPLLLAALPLGIIYAVTKNARKRLLAGQFLRALWTYVFLGGLLTMLIKLFPPFYQQNQVTQALVLPFAFVLSFAGGWLGKKR